MVQTSIIETGLEKKNKNGQVRENSSPHYVQDGTVLERIRRIDWRFLLPEPNLRRVGYLGPQGTPLHQALTEFSQEVVDFNNHGQCSGTFDVLVSTSKSLSQLRPAVEQLQPGGFLYLEWRRTQPWQSPFTFARTLAKLGLSQIKLHWQRPGFGSCLDMIPLQEKGALRHIFARKRHTFKGWLLMLVGHVLINLDLVPRLVGNVSIVAQKRKKSGPGSDVISPGRGGVLNTVLRFLQEKELNLGLPRFGDPRFLECVVVTPRFKASAHLLFFVMSKDKRQPVLVVKVPRVPGDNARLDREFDNLSRLYRLRKNGFDSVPRVVAYEDFGGHRLLVETAVAGDPMRPSFVRKNRQLSIESGVEWLMELHRASAKTRDAGKRLQAQYKRMLDTLSLFSVLSPPDSELPAVTRRHVEMLSQIELPSIFEHGDFSSPNLLISEEHQLGVVDWEMAQTAGLPATDLFFCLSYIAFSLEDARRLVTYMSAFQKAFFGKDAWAKSHISGYFRELGLPAEAAKPLFVICWGRYVASLVNRLATSEGALTSPNKVKHGNQLNTEMAEWLMQNRYYCMWRYTLENYDDLNLTD